MLSDDQILIRDTARSFARERLKPFSAKWDREARFPREAIAEMGALGFMGMLVPEEHGGAAADHVAYALAIEEVAAGDGAVSTVMSVHNSVGCMPILKFGSDEQKARFLGPLARGEQLGAFCLTEPGAGSDAAALKTRARRSGNAWVLSGTDEPPAWSAAGSAEVFSGAADPRVREQYAAVRDLTAVRPAGV